MGKCSFWDSGGTVSKLWSQSKQVSPHGKTPSSYSYRSSLLRSQLAENPVYAQRICHLIQVNRRPLMSNSKPMLAPCPLHTSQKRPNSGQVSPYVLQTRARGWGKPVLGFGLQVAMSLAWLVWGVGQKRADSAPGLNSAGKWQSSISGSGCLTVLTASWGQLKGQEVFCRVKCKHHGYLPNKW